MMSMKTIRMTLVLVIFRQGSCFGLFAIAGWTQYIQIFVEYNLNLHSLQNRLEKLTKGLLFYLFLKLVQMIFLFSPQCVYIIYLLFLLDWADQDLELIL